MMQERNKIFESIIKQSTLLSKSSKQSNAITDAAV